MKTKDIERFISGFLLSERFSVHRNLLLIVTLLSVSLDVVLNQPTATSPLQIFVGFIAHGSIMILFTYVNIRSLIPRLLMKEKWFAYFLSVILLAFVTVVFIACLQLLFFKIGDAIPIMKPSIFIINFTASLMIFAMINMGISTVVLFRNWAISSQRIQELESATLESELRYLKGQINPHFLFNMLNSVNVLLKERTGGASGVLSKLEDLLKYQLNESTGDRIDLNSDILFLNDFLNLEKIRRDNFGYSINTVGVSENVSIPPLMFIPFVENAVKYSQDSDRESYVHITFFVDAKNLTFYCENSKPPDGIRKKGGGLGLKNIKRRLELLFPGKYKLDINDEETLYTINLQISL